MKPRFLTALSISITRSTQLAGGLLLVCTIEHLDERIRETMCLIEDPVLDDIR